MSARKDDSAKLNRIATDADRLCLKLNELLKSEQSTLTAAICAVISLSEQMRAKHPALYAQCEEIWHKSEVRT